MKQKGFVLTLFVIVFVIGLLPILMMVYDTFSGGGELYKKLIETQGAIQSFQNSLLLSFVVAGMTTIIGTFIAVLCGKTDFYFSKILLLLLIVPLLLPPYIIALGWIDVIGVRGGISELLFGFWGTVWVLFSVYLPIPILLTLFFLKQIDSKLEEAGLLFARAPQVLKAITIPLILPSIILSFLLVFILTFGEYSVANVLRYSVFPLESFVQFSAFYDFDAAVVMAIPMLLIAIIVLLIEQFYVEKHIVKYKTFNHSNVFKLEKKIQLFFLVLGGLFTFIVVLLPLLSIFFAVGSLESFMTAFEKAFDPLTRSIRYASLGALILMVFGFLTGYTLELKIPYVSRALDMSILFLFVLPATVLGIAMILFWNRPLIDFVYTSPLILLFGYFAKYLLLTAKIAQNRLAQIPKSMIEAAEISGANWFDVLRYILIPISKKTLLALFVVGFIFALRENTMTMLVYPPGHETLPVYIVTQMANGKEEIIASLCVIMILTALIPFLLTSFIFTKRRSHA